MWKYQIEEREKVKRSGKKNMKSSPFNEKFKGLVVRDRMIFSKKNSFDITLLIGDNLFFFSS